MKAKIQATQLINLLQNRALKDKEVSSTRIDAAKFLLNKVLSNPAADSNLNHTGTVRFGWMT